MEPLTFIYCINKTKLRGTLTECDDDDDDDDGRYNVTTRCTDFTFIEVIFDLL